MLRPPRSRYSRHVSEIEVRTEVEEVLRRAQDRLVKIVPNALGVIEQLLDAPDDKVRLAAAKDILDRAGLTARVKVEGEFTVTMDDEIERLLTRLARPEPVIDLEDDDVVEVEEEDVDESPALHNRSYIFPMPPEEQPITTERTTVHE